MSPEVRTGLIAFGITLGATLGIGGIVVAMISPEAAIVVIAGSLFMLILFGLLVGLISIFALITSIGTVCPECGKRWAKIFVSSKIIDEKKCYGLVWRSGSTSWKERVPVIQKTHLRYYQCKHCQAEWTEEKVKEVEDFDIERE